MLNKKLFIVTIFFIILHAAAISAPVHSTDVVIFPVFTGEIQHDEILKTCRYMAEQAFLVSGRFIPIPDYKSEEYLKRADGRDRYDLYRKTASSAGAELLCVFELSSDKGDLKLLIKIEPLDELYSNLESEEIVTAKIPANLANKVAREISLLLKNEKLKCRVSGEGGGIFRLNAGQWHGLRDGLYSTTAGKIRISGISRFDSYAEGVNLKDDGTVEFDLYPDMDNFLKRIKRGIDENSARFYGTDQALNKRMGSAKEAIIGTCVINQGASFCLPGYGSFLSTEYMGIEKGVPDMAGVFATGGITALQLTLPSIMNGYDINFFPWVMDNEKGKDDRRLQIYLWATLPLTFSVSFYNQLAYQYHRKSLLPPLFADNDATAAVVSVFIPGGGMFYKGYRFEGWSFYLAEMSLGGYAVYDWDETSGKAAAGALLLMKAAEVIVSYAVSPSYGVYRKEIGSNSSYPVFSAGINQGASGSQDLTLSATVPF